MNKGKCVSKIKKQKQKCIRKIIVKIIKILVKKNCLYYSKKNVFNELFLFNLNLKNI